MISARRFGLGNFLGQLYETVCRENTVTLFWIQGLVSVEVNDQVDETLSIPRVPEEAVSEYLLLDEKMFSLEPTQHFFHGLQQEQFFFFLWDQGKKKVQIIYSI